MAATTCNTLEADSKYVLLLSYSYPTELSATV